MKRFTSITSLGFTLVEMLVSMSVLALLVVLLAQMFAGATTTVTSSRRRLDADGHARMVLDRLSNDLARMVMRKDVDLIAKNDDTINNGGAIDGGGPMAGANKGLNDTLFFYSEAPGYLSSSASQVNRSPLSLVGYRVNTSTWQLERLGQALPWDAANSITFLTFDKTTGKVLNPSRMVTKWAPSVGSARNFNNSTSTDYQPIGDQVFRLEYCYLLKDGNYSTKPYIAATPFLHTKNEGFQDVSALVVALGILDSGSRVLTTNLAKSAEALADITESDLASKPPILMSATWGKKILGGAFASEAGIPQAAASEVRIYQRSFYLNK